MSLSDPLGDMITRIRNGQSSGKAEVNMPSSKLKLSVCEVLQEEGYIRGYSVEGTREKATLKVALKYFKGEPVIETLQRVSKPGRRVYEPAEKLPSVLGGLGVAIVSTSKGVMSDSKARSNGHGGEVLCIVS